jgi:hypothetical protein
MGSISTDRITQTVPPHLTTQAVGQPGAISALQGDNSNLNQGAFTPYSLISDETMHHLPDSIFTSSRGTTPLYIHGHLNPLLAEDLKRISFFELMKTPPSMHQLFSHDFKVLVQNVIKLQNESAAFEQVRRGPHMSPDTIMKGEIFIGNEAGTLSSTAIGHEITSESTANPNQNTSWNHLLYPGGSEHRRSESNQRTPPSPRHQKFQQEKKPYFEKRTKTGGNRYSRKLLKHVIKGLRNLSNTLSKYSE